MNVVEIVYKLMKYLFIFEINYGCNRLSGKLFNFIIL